LPPKLSIISFISFLCLPFLYENVYGNFNSNSLVSNANSLISIVPSEFESNFLNNDSTSHFLDESILRNYPIYCISNSNSSLYINPSEFRSAALNIFLFNFSNFSYYVIISFTIILFFLANLQIILFIHIFSFFSLFLIFKNFFNIFLETFINSFWSILPS